MSLRITPQILTESAIRNAQQRTSQLGKLQGQISSGIRIEKASDDPGAIGSLLANKRQERRLAIDQQNIEAARSRLNQSVSHLLAAKSIFEEAKTLALDGVQSLDKPTLAGQVNALVDRLVAVANSSDGGDYLFSGTASSTPPFEVLQRDRQGQATQVAYQGNEQRSAVVIGQSTSVETLYSGQEIFQDRQRQPTVYIGETGARAGTAVDSGLGQGALQVTHTSTDYAPGSGLQPGTDSPGGDTIIGQHTLTVDSTNNTISLDGAAPVAFTGSETNLAVSGPNGTVVHVDMTNLTPGFNGDVAIVGNGMVSVDEGTSQVAIDFTDNQVVTDSRNGRVTHVDTTDITRTGTDQLEYHGTSDAFEVLMQLRDELLNTRNLPKAEWDSAMQRRIQDVERVLDNVLDAVGEQSMTLTNLDALQFRAESYQLETRKAISQVESADLSQVAIQFQNEQHLLQYTYAAAVRMLDVSLLDFIS